MQPVSIQIKLHTLNCIKKTLGKKANTEPYLRAIFFKIDGSTVRISDNYRLTGNAVFHYANESHGKFAISKSTPDSIKIPDIIGEWKTGLTPLLVPYFEQYLPSITGVVAIFVEQRNDKSMAKNSHQQTNKLVENAVNDMITAFDPRRIKIQNIRSSVQRFFQDKISSLRDAIDEHILEMLKKEQGLFRSLFGARDKERILGSYVWYFDQNEIAAHGKNGIDFGVPFASSMHGEWEVLGNVKLIDDRPKVETPVEKEVEKQEIEPGRAPIPKQPTLRRSAPKRRIEYLIK